MVMEPMDIVKQTGKTIIFEEFNKDKPDLATLLTRDEKEISLAKFKDILMGEGGPGQKGELVVESFEEFVEKFSPTIYETVVKTGDNTSQFVYELEKPNYDCTEIKLKDHAFYKMVMALINRKASSGKSNLAFPYDDLKKTLTPESELEACKRIRKKLQSNMQEYLKLAESGEPSADLMRYASNIEACRDEIISKYQNKSPLALLPLLIADKQRQLDKLDQAEETEMSGGERLIPYSISIDDKGNLVLLEQSISDDCEPDMPALGGNTQLVKALKDDFSQAAPIAIRNNSYISDLVVNVFAPNGTVQLSTQTRAELEAGKKQYQDVYKSSLASFAKAVSAVVEKFAGMKAFFDHATYDGKLAKNVSIIIANCKVDVILNDERAKSRFIKYFKGLSIEKDINRIWFGIIPGIAYDGAEEIAETTRTIDPFAPRVPGNSAKKKNKSGLVSIDSAFEMLELLKQARIMTFINYKASERTGFAELTAEQVNEYKRTFENVNNEYAVFAYPNFTILPGEKNAVKIGTEFNEYEQRQKDSYVQIPGIYLDAAYVAAGMMVGIQDCRLLRSKGYTVEPKYPCVRFDIEDENNAKRITTKLNRELSTEMERETLDAIMENRFGFVFASNRIIYDGVDIVNSYVLNARTLMRDGRGYYKSIYKVLVRNLVDQILRASSATVTQNSVQQFISDYADAWTRNNKDAERKYANRILLEKESIDLDPKTHKLVMKFQQDEEVWNDIIIQDDTVNSESEE